MVVLPWETAGGRFQPARIIDAWVGEAGLTADDPLFSTMLNGYLDRPPSPFTNNGNITYTLRRMGTQADLKAHLTTHSGRRGWATIAARENPNLDEVMAHTRHRNVDTLRLYIQRNVAGNTAVPDAVQQAILAAME